MVTNKYIRLLSIYVFTMLSLVYINFLVNSEYEKQLKSVNNQLHGIEYIFDLYKLNLSLAKFLQFQDVHNQSTELQKTVIANNIKTILATQKKYPLFENKKFNKTLQRVQTFKFTKYEIYNFVDTINKENYLIGDLSEIHFQRDRELYFLGSLITHYMPEYLVSSLIAHGILENYLLNSYISDQDKNFYIEQNKLVDLSLEELTSIIKLLKFHPTTLILQKKLDKIKSLEISSKDIFSDKTKLLKYITQTHTILELSYQLYNDNFALINKRLLDKQSYIEQKLSLYKIIFITLMVMFSVLIYLYYKLNISNLAKDRKIRDITEILDEFVIFSKADKNGIITYASSALETISGYTQKELIGSSYRIFKNEKMDKHVYKELWTTILSKKTFNGQLLNKAKDGSDYWVQETITPELDHNGKIVSFNVYMVDITDKINLECAHKKLQKISVLDPLTQVYNRLKLDAIIQQEYETYKRYSKVFSIILIDIDYFKNVNDEYGHLVGDEVLKQMTLLIKKNLRESDHFGRWGGEEFLIISEFTDANDAYILAEKIRKLVEAFEFKTVGKRTISLGISQIDKELSINDLLKEADDALYKAKNCGRNRTIIYKK